MAETPAATAAQALTIINISIAPVIAIDVPAGVSVNVPAGVPVNVSTGGVRVRVTLIPICILVMDIHYFNVLSLILPKNKARGLFSDILKIYSENMVTERYPIYI